MRQSTQLKRELKQYGCKRVIIDPYRPDLFRATLPEYTPFLCGELMREKAKMGCFLVPSKTLIWIYFKRV